MMIAQSLERFQLALERRNDSRTESSPDRPLTTVAVEEEMQRFLTDWSVPSEFRSFLERHSYDHHVTMGHLTFDCVNSLAEENLDEGNAACVEAGLLIIGSGLNGDPIVLDLRAGTVGYVKNDDLFAEDDDRRPVREVFRDSGLDVGSFYLAAALYQDAFPVDGYEAEDLEGSFSERFPL